MGLKDMLKEARFRAEAAYDNIISIGKNISKMSPAEAAFYAFATAATPAIIMQVNCGGDSSSGNSNYVAPVPGNPTQNDPANNQAINFDAGESYANIGFSGVETQTPGETVPLTLDQAISYLGGISINQVGDPGTPENPNPIGNKLELTAQTLKDLYEGDPDFKAKLVAVYSQALDFANGVSAEAQVDSLVDALTNNVGAGLASNDGTTRMHVGKVNVDGNDRYFIAFDMVDQNGPFAVITYGGTNTPTGADVNNADIMALYNHIKGDPSDFE